MQNINSYQPYSTQKKIIDNFDSTFSDGVTLINTQQWAFAYLIFSTICKTTKSKSISLSYNMALCHFTAQEYSKAFQLLSEILTQLSSPSSGNFTIEVTLPSNLLTIEYETNAHRLAFAETITHLHQNLIKLRVRRLLVDVHFALEKWEEVIRLATLPDMDKCQNVKIALEKSIQNQNK